MSENLKLSKLTLKFSCFFWNTNKNIQYIIRFLKKISKIDESFGISTSFKKFEWSPYREGCILDISFNREYSQRQY